MYDSLMDLSIKAPDTTRQKLLQAAFTEIYRHGFQAASLTQILSDTALTKGALYHALSETLPARANFFNFLSK